MATTGLNHVNFRVPPAVLVVMRDFYCDTIGLTVGERPPFGSAGYWLYAGATPIVHLSVTRDDAPRATDAASTFDHVAFSCTELAAMRTRLDTLGIAYTLNTVPLRRQTQLFLRDPAGNGIELNFTEDA